MTDVSILTEGELRQCAVINEEALLAVESAFTWLQEGKVEMPPIMHIEVADAEKHRGDVDIKSAYVRGLDRFAVKLGSGFFDNPLKGLPSSNAMMVMMSAHTGFCEAVLLDNGYLTDLRTGLAGAVAAKYLAPEHIETVGVIGSGAQARYQIESLALVRNFKRLLVSARSAERLVDYVSDMQQRLSGVEVVVADSLEQLVRDSQVVVCTTSSAEPLIQAEWLHPGLHITAMGSDLAGKQELSAAVLLTADQVVCDRKSQCYVMGELQHVKDQLSDSEVLELGQLTSGEKVGRRSEEAITICDLTGTGVQDTAIANLSCDKAQQLGLGTVVTL